MGVYINMEMPTNCEDCPMCHSNAEYDYAYCCVSSAETSGNKIPSNCPITTVPPHGRLIDADALREDWLENGENEYVYDTNAFLDSLDDAPTILEAEEASDEYLSVLPQ